ncbi:hypothetical protein Y693_25990 [Bacillus anthracis str. 95014]|nr:hypothetical protein Y693_25990 [Bacillus anthracis str. 95014]
MILWNGNVAMIGIGKKYIFFTLASLPKFFYQYNSKVTTNKNKKQLKGE